MRTNPQVPALLLGLLLFTGCDVLEQVSGTDPVKDAVRDNPLDPVSAHPLVFGLDSDNSTVGSVRPSIVFQFTPGVVSYTLQIDDTADFSNDLDYEEAGISEGTHRIIAPLANHGEYHWRVRPRYDNGNDGGWSEARELVVELPVPMTGTPSGSSYVTSSDPRLSWPEVSQNSQYEWELAKEPSFGEIVDSGTTVASSTSLSISLVNNHTYHWRVRITESGVAGDWGAVNAFVVALPKPTFTLLTSSGTFRSQWYDSPFTAVTGDFNADGRPDFAILAKTKLVQFYQQDDGSFGEPVEVETGIELRQVLARDINQDGAIDFVVAGNTPGPEVSTNGAIGVFLRNPESHILAAPVWTATQFWVARIAFFHLDGDASPNLALVGIGSDAKGKLSTLTGSTTGAFHGEQIVADIVPYFRQYYDDSFSAAPNLAAGDLNNDGSDELVFWTDSGELTVLTAAATGGFSPSKLVVQTQYWPGSQNFDIGDLNGDGLNDIIVTDLSNSPKMNIFFQNAGELTGPIVLSLQLGSAPMQIKIADIDDDGLNDLVAGDSSTAVLFQTPKKTYGTELVRGVGGIAELLAIVDWDSDGDLDFLGVGYSYDRLVVVQQVP